MHSSAQFCHLQNRGEKMLLKSHREKASKRWEKPDVFVCDRNHSSYSERLKQAKSSSRSRSSLMRSDVWYLIRAGSPQALKKVIHLGDIKKSSMWPGLQIQLGDTFATETCLNCATSFFIVILPQPRAIADTELK